MKFGQARGRRLLWIVNHKTLLPAEVPIFRELGFEVFIPKRIPNDPGYRSGIVTDEYDSSLTISREVLDVLNAHEFYGELNRYRAWSPTLTGILNDNFDVLISSLSAFISPLREAVRNFDGLVLARVFGLTHPNTYEGLLRWLGYADLIDDMASRGDRYAFVQGYSNLAEIEPAGLAANAHTVTVPLPEAFFRNENTWAGGGSKAIFVCPGIEKIGYYRDVYAGIKRNFHDLPHVIFGRQVENIEDDSLLPYLSDAELLDLYRTAPVFVYPSSEARHIHYSPIEAMVVGAPVLYLKGSLTDLLSGDQTLPGCCVDSVEMLAKARQLIAGDTAFAARIRAGQGVIVDAFRVGLARQQWSDILAPVAKTARR